MKKSDIEFEKFRQTVINRIKTKRKELNLTQEDMEDSVFGINVRTYQRIEGLETDLSLKNLFLICKRLDIRFESLFRDL